MTRRFVQLLPLEPASFAVFLELADDSGADDPFVRLDSVGGTTHVYRGSLRSANGTEVDRVVVQIPALPSVRGAGPEVSQRLGPASPLRRMGLEWQRRWTDQGQLAATSQRLFPKWLLPNLDGDQAERRLPAMIYCRQRQRLLPIPSPWSLRPLTTCHDDELLVRWGLPPSAGATLPILVDASSVADEDPPRFYVAAETVPDELAGQGVVGLRELRAELAATFSERLIADPTFDINLYPSTESTAEATESGGGAEPPAPWFVFSPCEVPFLVRRWEPWDLERFVDFLGGRAIDPQELSFDENPDSPDRDPSLESEKAASQRQGGYLFTSEGSGLDAVEVLTLKLGLFAQIVEAVDRYSRRLGPHLDIHPGHLVVSGPRPGHGLLPERWHFNVRLLGLSRARRPDLPQGVVLATSPPRPRRPYASKAVREAALIEWCDGELIIDQVQQVGEGDNRRWRLKGRLKDASGILPPPRAGDSLIVHWPHQLLGRAEMQTTAAADPASSTSQAELVFYTEPLALEESQTQRLESATGTVLRGGRYRLLPRLDVTDDLYSLGILLLRLLLVNDHQDLSVVENLLRDLPQAGGLATDTQGLTYEQRLEAAFANALEEQAEELAASNIFFSEEDRLNSRANAIPLELWTETLRLAWRLVAFRPALEMRISIGLSVDRAAEDPVAHLTQIHQETTRLMRRLQAILFRRQGVHVEMHSVIAEMMNALGDGVGSGG